MPRSACWRRWCTGKQRAHVGYLVLSAGCGALAVLSKSPGLVMLPMIAAIALLSAWEQTAPLRQTSNGYRSFALCALRCSCIWGAVFVLTILLVWPATWADPLRVYELLRTGVEAEGAQPHMTGNFSWASAPMYRGRCCIQRCWHCVPPRSL
ncbi:MAG: hypothetical protein HC876_21150 [Chloroflexaceae bacterium]|nr:hypothetical protein [Chloroflexaceae bacterium]